MLVALASPLAAAKQPPKAAAAEEDDDEAREFRFEFGLFGGYRWFTKDHGLGRSQGDPESWSPASSVAFGARLSLNFNPYVSVEGEAIAIPSHLRDRSSEERIFGGRGQLLVHFVGSGPFRPFITLGYGTLSSIVQRSTAPVGNDTDGFLHGGLGAKIAFGAHVGLRLEGRITGPPSFLGGLVPVGDELGFGGWDFEALGSLYLRFGEVERSRQVFVEKTVEKTTISSDPDGDGIAGDADKCPNVAEDKDGFQDEDGCPDPDNDGDGIPDLQDKCPNKPENKNGIEDDDGCPEEDLDGDGIWGAQDKCPNEPETKNGYQDQDGCPDEVPRAVARFTGIIEGINFKTGSADITAASYGLLDRAAQVLTDYPEVRMEISGHTDSRGGADFNRELSARRAEAVKSYLVGKGIKSDRLTSIGYGMDRPIASNKTDAGRGRNRRTEFRLISSTGEAAPSSIVPPSPTAPIPQGR
ncbi:MAG TPA: OmpA family protein [Polyangia bacterium]|nr:OmpA family protein [Polyangia bacterium]